MQLFRSCIVSLMFAAIAACQHIPVDASGAISIQQFGSMADDIANGIVIDSYDNAFVAGYTYGAFDNNSNVGGGDFMLLKFDTRGVKQWTRIWGTVTNEVLTAIARDANDELYLAGYAFDGPYNKGTRDVIVMKCAPDGTLRWSRQFGTKDNDVATAISVSASGEIYVAGYTRGALDGELNHGGDDAFLTKFDADGNRIWTRLWGSSAQDRATGVAIDKRGDIVVVGFTAGTLDGNTSAGGTDFFATKFSPDGRARWTRQYGTALNDNIRAIQIDAANAIYLAGHVSGQIEAKGSDLLLAKLDTNGALIWQKQDGTAAEEGTAMVLYQDRLYIAGNTTGELARGSHVGGDDGFIAEYDLAGNRRRAFRLGVENTQVNAIAATRDGTLYISGVTYGAFPGYRNAGLRDAFVARYHF